ncbi:CPK3, partial [Symbiodinium pilosum]
GSLREGLASSIMRQVFSALRYCHERNVLHRDLKPDNIMVQHHSCETPPATPAMMAPEVKLIDFGLAVITTREVLGRSGSSVIGSEDYLAPEARQGSHLPASDVWSAGMVLHAMLRGSLPKWENDKELDFDTAGYKSLSSSARDLLKGLLALDAADRLPAAAALAHPWTQGLESRTPKDLTPTLTSFVAFHRSAKLRRAALAALATQLTSWQLRDLREQFLLVDANGDGRISKEDLTMSIALSSPGGAAEDVRRWVETIFDSVFLEGDRDIEYTEWLAAVLQQGEYVSEEAVRAAFRIFDTDGDGFINQGELGQVLAQTPEEVAGFFPDFDTNGDGVLDFNEFKGIFTGDAGGVGASLHCELHSPCYRSVVSL